MMQATDGFKLSKTEVERLEKREYEFDKETDQLAAWLIQGNQLNDETFNEVYQAAKDNAEFEEVLTRQSVVTQSLQSQNHKSKPPRYEAPVQPDSDIEQEHSIMLDDKQSTDESQVDNDSHGSSSHHAVLSRNRLRNNELTRSAAQSTTSSSSDLSAEKNTKLSAVQAELASVKRELIKLQKSRPGSPELHSMRQVESELGEVKQELIKLRALSRPASPKLLNRSIRRLDSPVSSLSASVTTSAPSSTQLLNDRTMMLVKDRWAQLV